MIRESVGMQITREQLEEAICDWVNARLLRPEAGVGAVTLVDAQLTKSAFLIRLDPTAWEAAQKADGK